MEGINEGHFMEEIRLFPVIWNKFMTEFKNKHKKVNAFKEVGEKFSLSAENSEKKYSSIRTMFGRYMRKKPSGTGSGKKTPQDTFYESLARLKPFIKMKTTISNFRYVDEDEMNDESFVSAATEDENVLGDPGENLLDDSVVPFSLLSDPDTSVAPSEPGTCTNRGKKRKSETEEEFEKACRAIQEANKRNNDPDEMTLYFLSIAKRGKFDLI